jgi:hypothetical protein
MTLSDLMKKGFLTAATATPATVATHKRKTTPTVATVAGVAVANFQKSESGAKVLALPELVREFMEVDGLSLTEAQALAAVSVQPRAPEEWLALIAELDALIERYCAAVEVTDEARAVILAAKCAQSLASIPSTLEWFRRELALLADRP